MSVPPPFQGGVDDGITTGVFDTEVTRACHNHGQPETCVSGQPLAGCSNDFADGEVIFAWPDCATIGQVSGTIYKPGGFSADSLFDPGKDDDYTFHLCPEAMSVRLPNDTWIPKELREANSFYGRRTSGLVGDQPVGRIHIETQGCRLYDGTYKILDPGTTNAREYSSRPIAGDLVTAAGDWVWDRFHEINDGQGWIELHEARITAAARRAPVPTDGSVSYIFVSSAFLDGSAQKDLLEIDARVPEPPAQPNVVWTLTSCEVDPNFSGVVKRPVCSAYPASHVNVNVHPSTKSCNIRVDQINLSLADIGRRFDGYNCEDSCDGVDFHEEDIVFDQGTSDETVLPSSCDRVAFTGVVKATWTAKPGPIIGAPVTAAPLTAASATDAAPGDLWMCQNCACADPAAPGVPLPMPVMGCATSGLDPTKATDRAVACLEACGDFVSTGRRAGQTGLCSAPAAGTAPAARLVGRHACVPGSGGDTYRPTTAANYHVTLKPFAPGPGQPGSFASFTVGSAQAPNVPLRGELSFNLGTSFDIRSSGLVGIFDLADLEIAADDFTLENAVKGAKVFIGQRLWAKFSNPSQFAFPPRSVVLGVRADVDGAPLGINEENASPASGTIDLANRVFTLDVAAQDVDQGTQRSMVAHLVGTIDDLPPHAVITGPSVVECGHAATLSAGSSTDPDDHDAVSRFQWLVNGRPGGTQDHIAIASAQLGKSEYDLRVYDKAMGADHATTSVQVVDTSPPALPTAPSKTIFAPTDAHHPPSLDVALADCVGAKVVGDVCSGPVDVQARGTIEHIELLGLDQDHDHDSDAELKRELKDFERQSFFRDGCEHFAIAASNRAELPLHPQPLRPGAAFRVTYSIPDPAGNRAVGQCTINLVPKPDGKDPHQKSAPLVAEGCALCIGNGCPSTCPRAASVCATDRDHGKKK